MNQQLFFRALPLKGFSNTALSCVFGVLLLSSGCSKCNRSSNNGPGSTAYDTLSVPDTIDEAANAPVFVDEQTVPIVITGGREPLSFYRAIPDKFLPVAGKPEDGITIADKVHKYMHITYSPQLNTSMKVFRDLDTGREYFVIQTTDCRKPQCTNTLYVFYMKAKHAIELTEELVPRLADGLLRDAYARKGQKAPKGKIPYYLSIAQDKDEILVRTDPDPAKGLVLLSLQWKYGRFTVVE